MPFSACHRAFTVKKVPQTKNRWWAPPSLAIMVLFVYTTTSKRYVTFTCRYFKLSWKTTALSQSNCWNCLWSSVSMENHSSMTGWCWESVTLTKELTIGWIETVLISMLTLILVPLWLQNHAFLFNYIKCPIVQSSKTKPG